MTRPVCMKFHVSGACQLPMRYTGRQVRTAGLAGTEFSCPNGHEAVFFTSLAQRHQSVPDRQLGIIAEQPSSPYMTRLPTVASEPGPR